MEPAAPLPYKCRDRGSDGRRAKRGKRGNKGQPGTSKGKRYLYLTKTFGPWKTFFLCGKQSPFGKRHSSQNSCHFRFWVKSFRLTLISITFLTLTLQILSISWSIITALHLFLTLICGIYCAFRYLFLSLTFCQMLTGLDRPSFFFSVYRRPTDPNFWHFGKKEVAA